MGLITQIGADASNYNKVMAGLPATAATAANGISSSFVKASQSTDKLGMAAMSASMRFQTMRSGISAARDGVLAFSIGGQAGERSLLAMGHHLTSLVNETGSATGAFKALLSSLAGPGGIILAISLAAELWSKYSDSQKKAADTADDFTKALDAGIKSSSEELSHVMILYQATQNENLSRGERLTAVKELQKEYPNYFGNLTQEAILAGKAAGAYDRLAQSIINSAVVKAGQESLAEQLKPLIELTAQLQAEQYKLEKGFKPGGTTTELATSTPGFTKFNSTQKNKPVLNQGFIQEQNGDLKTLDEYKKAIQDKIKANAGAIQTLLEQYGVSTLLKNQEVKEKGNGQEAAKTLIQVLEAELKALQDEENKWIEQGNKADFFNLTARERNINAIIAKIDQLKEADKGVKAPNFSGQTQNSINAIPSAQVGILGVSDKEFDKAIENLNQLRNLKNAARISGEDFNAENRQEIVTLRELTNVLGSGLTGAFESVLNGTQSLVQGMVQFLEQLIIKLIAAAAATAVLVALLSLTTFGSNLVASGGGTAGIFGMLSGLSGLTGTSNIPKHAQGGIATRATLGIIGEAGPEAILPLSHLNNMLNNNRSNNNTGRTIVGEISGSKLLLWENRAQKSKSRIG